MINILAYTGMSLFLMFLHVRVKEHGRAGLKSDLLFVSSFVFICLTAYYIFVEFQIFFE